MDPSVRFQSEQVMHMSTALFVGARIIKFVRQSQ